jgi:hypothetical protein
MATYEKGNLYQISVADFKLDPTQPRKVVDPDALAELATSTDEGRESFRITLVELRDKIDRFLSPSSALA